MTYDIIFLIYFFLFLHQLNFISILVQFFQWLLYYLYHFKTYYLTVLYQMILMIYAIINSQNFVFISNHFNNC